MDFYQRTKGGYIYDKRILWGGFLICCLIAVFIFYKYNFDFSRKIYFNCESYSCKNPFIYEYPDFMKYCKYEWCNEENLPFGEYGEAYPKNDFLFNHFGKLSFLIMLFVVFLNHLIHNRNNKFEFLPIELPRWLEKLGKKLQEKAEELEE